MMQGEGRQREAQRMYNALALTTETINHPLLAQSYYVLIIHHLDHHKILKTVMHNEYYA